MSDDWDTVTKIGSRVRTGGGAQRETVIRGKSQLNAASRSGNAISTEKKFATGNASGKGGTDGQRLTKIDRSDDIVKPDTLSRDVQTVVRDARNRANLSQAELATRCNKPAQLIKDLENVNAKTQPRQDVLAAVENVLNVKLRGKDIGAPKFPKRKEKEEEEKKAAAGAK